MLHFSNKKSDFFWAKLAGGKEGESMNDREGSGISQKGDKHDCESSQYRCYLFHWADTWKSDKGSRSTGSQDSVTAMVTAARLALGDGHKEVCQATTSREGARTLLDLQLAKVQGWFQAVQNLQFVHVQVWTEGAQALRYQILRLHSLGNSRIRNSRRGFLKNPFVLGLNHCFQSLRRNPSGTVTSAPGDIWQLTVSQPRSFKRQFFWALELKFLFLFLFSLFLTDWSLCSETGLRWRKSVWFRLTTDGFIMQMCQIVFILCRIFSCT